MGLRVDDRGLEFRQLNIEAGPGVAETLLEILAEIGRGHDILPHEWRERILGDRSPNDRESRLWRYSFKPAGVPDELPGRIPLLEEIELLAALAKECYERGYDEPGWNSEVHQEMLKAIFREPGKMKSGLFNFTNWLAPTFFPQYFKDLMLTLRKVPQLALTGAIFHGKRQLRW